jgi:hypothetical protein
VYVGPVNATPPDCGAGAFGWLATEAWVPLES